MQSRNEEQFKLIVGMLRRMFRKAAFAPAHPAHAKRVLFPWAAARAKAVRRYIPNFI